MIYNLASRKPRGFTLIELLIVMAIIGILISVITINFTTAQKQARDSRRKQDIESIQTALEQHYSVNGAYPAAGSEADAFDSGQLPTDPKDEVPYQYVWNLDTGGYCVCAALEKQTGNANDPGNATVCDWNNTDGQYLCVQNQQ